jgi:hypothetical protein
VRRDQPPPAVNGGLSNHLGTQVRTAALVVWSHFPGAPRPPGRPPGGRTSIPRPAATRGAHHAVMHGRAVGDGAGPSCFSMPPIGSPGRPSRIANGRPALSRSRNGNLTDPEPSHRCPTCGCGCDVVQPWRGRDGRFAAPHATSRAKARRHGVHLRYRLCRRVFVLHEQGRGAPPGQSLVKIFRDCDIFNDNVFPEVAPGDAGPHAHRRLPRRARPSYEFRNGRANRDRHRAYGFGRSAEPAGPGTAGTWIVR